MKTTLRIWTVTAALACSAGTGAQTASPGKSIPQETFTCRLPGTSDHRQIGIYRPGGQQRCRVDYTRDGKTRSLWSSGHDYKFCINKALEIVALLQNVNFQCAPHTRAEDSAPTR